MNRYVIMLAMLISFFGQITNSAVVGSTTTVSVEDALTFLSTETDNAIIGFAECAHGFILEDSSTSCTFDAFFPVSGECSLRGGTLFLQQDLMFKNSSTISSWGSVIGNNHTIDLCPSITALPLSSGTNVLKDVRLNVSSDLMLSGTVLVQGVSVINGNGATLSFDHDAVIIIDSGATLQLTAIELDGMHDRAIVCADNSASLVLDSVRWLQSGDFIFDMGSIVIRDIVDFAGSATFVYDSAQSSTIAIDSTWMFSRGMKLSLGKDELSNSPLVFLDATSVLAFENASMLVTAFGLDLKKGTIKIMGNDNLDIASTQTAQGLVLGDGIPENDFTVFLDAGASLNFNAGALIYNNSTSHGFVSAATNSRVIRYPDSLLYIRSNWEQPSYTLSLVGLVSTSVFEAGTVFSLHDTRTIFTSLGLDFNVTAQQTDVPVYILNGGKSINFNKGVLPIPIVVSGIDNTLHGNGSISSSIVLADSATELTIGLLGDVAEDITLNGGSLFMARSLNLVNDAIISGSGTVYLDAHVFEGALQDTVWTDTLVWSGNQATVNINGNLVLSGSWTFSGTCILDAGGNTIDLSNGGSIIVDNDASLIIRNARIVGIANENIQCSNAGARLTLDKVSWVQAGDFVFGNGSLLIKDSVRMSGDSYTFAYQTLETSTITSGAILYLDENFTFSYDPLVPEILEQWQQLLAFEDRTSVVQLDGATLHITAIGMILRKGELHVLSDSNVYVEPVLDEEGNPIDNLGLTFGDSTDSSNDMRLHINTGAILHLYEGNLIYRNLQIRSLRMESESATINMESNTALLLYQNFSTPHGTLAFYSNTILGRVIGITLNVTINFFGSVSYLDL